MNGKLLGFGGHLLAGFLIWVGGARLFGQMEPWDDRSGNGMIYLVFANATVGTVSGLAERGNRWLGALAGLLLGQILYLKSFSDGPLLGVGALYVLLFSTLAAGLHALAGWVRKNARGHG